MLQLFTKRNITIILLFALSLVSCGGDNDDTIDTDQTFLEKYDGTRWFIQIEDDQTFWRFNNSLAYPISVRYYDNYNDITIQGLS